MLLITEKSICCYAMSLSMIFMLLHHLRVNCISTFHKLQNLFILQFPLAFYHVNEIGKQP